MREFFIDTVLSWVESQYTIQKYLDKAETAWGKDYFKLSSRMSATYFDCFLDYLLFEHKPVFFYYKTGLEYFVDYNPQNLDQEILQEYREILQTNIAAVFEIKRVAPSAGMELYSKDTGNIFVNEEDVGDNWEVGSLVWARVAKLKGEWCFVNDFLPTLTPVNNTPKQQILRGMSMHEIALILFTDRELLSKMQTEENRKLEKFAKEHKEEFAEIEKEMLKVVKEAQKQFSEDATNPEKLLNKARKAFQQVRKRLDVEHLFTLDTFDKWIEKSNENDLDFAFKSLIFFVPEDFLERGDDHEQYIDAGQEYISAYLAKQRVEKMKQGLQNIQNIDDFKKFQKDSKNYFLKSKADFVREISVNIDGREVKGELFTKAYTWKDYQDLQFAGHRFLREGKHKESQESYLKLVEKLLKEETLFWPVFRVFANAASAHFMLGEFFMALGLVEASLRLNPQYEFGKMMKKNFLESVGAKKPNMEVVDGFYNKSIFAEYEKFLKKHEVNLNKKVGAKVRKFEVVNDEVKAAENTFDM